MFLQCVMYCWCSFLTLTQHLNPLCLILSLKILNASVFLCIFPTVGKCTPLPVFPGSIFVPCCSFCQPQLANVPFSYQSRKWWVDSMLALIGADGVHTSDGDDLLCMICRQSETTSFKQTRVWLFGSHQRRCTELHQWGKWSRVCFIQTKQSWCECKLSPLYYHLICHILF